jgi:indolepyruvate ferredoxin oxidoreductase
MKAMADAVKGPVDLLQDLRLTSLDDKYDLTKHRIFVSGPQAIVRLLLMQKELDRRNGLNTAGFVSGYRGSPLGGLDLTFARAKRVLDAAEVLFQPGLNEDLAATAIWGAQQAEMRGEGNFDGVFGLWYGKGPGVDRSGDVFRHANLAGSSKYGGVLALMGDDHTAESSTTAHQSEFNFVNVMIPILSPAGVQEIVDYGLYGYAMSRFTGAWVGLKCLKDTIESTGSIDVSLDRVRPVSPTSFAMPPGGLNIRPRETVLE